MATTLIGEMHGSPESSESDDGTRYIRRFRVRSNNKNDGPKTVKATPGLPRKGSIYNYHGETDAGAVVTDIDAVRENESWEYWTVEFRYSSKQTESKDDQESNLTPTERKPKYRWGFAAEYEVLEGAISGGAGFFAGGSQGDSGGAGGGQFGINPRNVAVCNSAGDVYDPAPKRKRYILELHITINEANFDHKQWLEYQDALNDDMFFGIPKGVAKINAQGSQEAFEKSQRYWISGYLVQFKKEGWKLKLLDYGPHYWEGGRGTGQRRRFLDERGHPTMGLLDGNGGQLAPFQPVRYLEFDQFESKPFGNLGIFGQ